MPPFLQPVIDSLWAKLTPTAMIDILAVAFLIYQFIVIVRGRRAAHVLTGLWILVVIYLVAVWAHLELLRTVLAALAPYTAIALIVMFQSEIRRHAGAHREEPMAGIGRTTRAARNGGRNYSRDAADGGMEDGRADRDRAGNRAADVCRKRRGAGRGDFARSAVRDLSSRRRAA